MNPALLSLLPSFQTGQQPPFIVFGEFIYRGEKGGSGSDDL